MTKIIEKKLLLVLLIGILFIVSFLPLYVSAEDGVKIETLITMTPAIEDSSVDGGNPSTNYGDDSYLAVSGDYQTYPPDHPYLKFPLGNKPNNWKKAEVSLYFWDIGEATTIAVYLVNNNSWEEDIITWNNKPSEGELITTFDISAETHYTFDVTNYIQDSYLSICVRYYNELDTNGAGSLIMSKDRPLSFDDDIPHIIWYYEVEKSITVISPDISDVWSFGTHTILWETSDLIEAVDIVLYKNDEKIDTLTTLYTENDGAFSWKIYKSDNETYLTGDDYQIKIIDDDDIEVYGFSDYFTINTTIDSSKGKFICPSESYYETFNAKKGHKYHFYYEFSNDQTFSISIYNQESLLLHQEIITSKEGSFEFTPDTTEVLWIMISIEDGDSCSYVKFSDTNPNPSKSSQGIPGYNLVFLLITFSFSVIVIILIKKYRYN